MCHDGAVVRTGGLFSVYQKKQQRPSASLCIDQGWHRALAPTEGLQGLWPATVAGGSSVVGMAHLETGAGGKGTGRGKANRVNSFCPFLLDGQVPLPGEMVMLVIIREE